MYRVYVKHPRVSPCTTSPSLSLRSSTSEVLRTSICPLNSAQPISGHEFIASRWVGAEIDQQLNHLQMTARCGDAGL
jgi:hypothetical protein